MKRSYYISHGFGFNGSYYCNGNAQSLDEYTLADLQQFVDAGYLTIESELTEEPKPVVKAAEPEKTHTEED